MPSRAVVVLAAVAASSAFMATTYAQTKLSGGNVASGRALALHACTGCHVVASDQPYMPIYKGVGHPPEFKDIANKPDIDAASLRAYLASLPTIPKSGKMANPDLTEDQIRDVSAFIMTLRGTSSSSSSSR